MFRKIQPKQKAKTNDLGRFHPPSFLVDLLRCSTEAAGQKGHIPTKWHQKHCTSKPWVQIEMIKT